MKLGCLEPSPLTFDFFVGREAFDPVCKGPALWNFGSCDELYFFRWNEIISWGKKHTALFQTNNLEKLVRVFGQLYANMWQGGHIMSPPLVLIGLRFCKTSSFLMVIITTTQTGGKYCQVRATFSTTFHLHNAKQIRPNIITRKTIFIFIQTSYSSCNQYPNVHLNLNLCHFDQKIKPWLSAQVFCL